MNITDPRFTNISNHYGLSKGDLEELGRLSYEDGELIALLASGYTCLEDGTTFKLPKSFFNTYLSVAIQLVVYAYSLGLRAVKH